MNRKDALRIIKQYGSDYGWNYSLSKGLVYSGLEEDAWSLLESARAGNKNAKTLITAISDESEHELKMAIKKLSARMASGKEQNAVNTYYEDKSMEILVRQLDRVIKAPSDESAVMFSEGVFRTKSIEPETGKEILRQTPRERASMRGIEARKKKSAEQLKKALKNPDTLRELASFGRTNKDGSYQKGSKIDFDSPEKFNAYAELAKNLYGVDIWQEVERQKSIVGSPYIALNNAYLQVKEQVDEQVQTMTKEELNEILSSPAFVDYLSKYEYSDVADNFTY